MIQIQRGTPLIEHIWKTSKSTNHVIRIIFPEKRFAHTREHFKESNILNIYQLNIISDLLFLHRVEDCGAPNVFLSKLLRPLHNYSTGVSPNNYIVPSFKLTKSKYRITIRVPKLWNIILNIEEKFIENPASFKATIKTKLLLLETPFIFLMHI